MGFPVVGIAVDPGLDVVGVPVGREVVGVPVGLEVVGAVGVVLGVSFFEDLGDFEDFEPVGFGENVGK